MSTLNTALAVGENTVVIGPQPVLDSFLATVAYRLEPGGRGTRFPVLMACLPVGYFGPDKAAEAAAELATIAREFGELPASKAVAGDLNPVPLQQAAIPARYDARNLIECFVTPDGRPILEVLHALTEQSRAQGLPVRMVARTSQVKAGRYLVLAVLGGIGSYLLRRYDPNGIIVPAGSNSQHGLLIWPFGLFVSALSLFAVLLDRLPALRGLQAGYRTGFAVLGMILMGLYFWLTYV